MPEALVRNGNNLLVGFVAGALLSLVLIESTFNGGFAFTVSCLWSPLLVLVLGSTWWYRERLYRIVKSKKKVWIAACLIYPFLLLMTWPYVMALNAITDSGEQITYRGPIVKKWLSQGKGKTYHLDILDEASGKVTTLNCSSRDYETLSEGQIVSRTFQVGGFGIPYCWRFSRG